MDLRKYLIQKASWLVAPSTTMRSTVKIMKRPIQDPADDGIPIIMDIIGFFEFPWEDEFEIQTV